MFKKIKSLLDKKIIKLILNILLMLGIVSFSFIFSVETKLYIDDIILIISLIGSAILGIILIKKDFVVKNLKKANKLELIIGLLFTIILMNEMRYIYDINNVSPLILKFFNSLNIARLIKISTKIFSLFFIYNAFLYFFRIIIRYFINFFKSLDKEELKFIKIFSAVLGTIIIISYSSSSLMYLAYDNFYSIDSYYVTNNMFNVFWTLDIRHILFAPIVIPIKVFTIILTKLFPFSGELYYILLALINVLVLGMISIMIKRLTNNKWTMYIYALSYPTILFSIITEKYQLCVFFIILYFYEKYYNKKDQRIENYALISTIGAMTNGLFLGFLSGHGKLKERIIYWLKMAIFFILVCCLFGKFGLLINAYDQVNNMLTGIQNITLIEKIYGLSELFYSFLFIPSYFFASSYIGKEVRFLNAAKYMNNIGLVIIILICICFFINRKNNYAKVSFAWIITAFILFIGMNWYCYEAPLFNIYFSWAGISLITMGIDKIFNEKNKKYIYLSIILLMILINIPELLTIYKYILAA